LIKNNLLRFIRTIEMITVFCI